MKRLLSFNHSRRENGSSTLSSPRMRGSSPSPVAFSWIPAFAGMASWCTSHAFLFSLRALGVMLVIVSAACGDDDNSHENTSPEGEGCEHRENGPFATATATASSGGAPLVELEHHDVDVTLATVGSGYGGFITSAVDAAGEYAIFLDQNVGMTVRDPQSAVVTIEDTVTSMQLCPSLIALYYVLELGVGLHSLEFAESGNTHLHVVLAPVGGEHAGE